MDNECEKAISEIKRYSLKGIPMHFHFNRKFYNIISTVLKKFKPRSYLGWADGDREIGNIKDK